MLNIFGEYFLNNMGLFNYKNNIKIVLIISNIIFLLYSIILLKQKKSFSIIFFIIFLISSLFHYHQCYSNNCTKYQIIDILVSISMAIFAFIYVFLFNKKKLKNKNIYIYNIILCLICFNIYNNQINYIIFHSLWHILSAILLYELLI
jgi:hypothetical protein